MLQAEDAIRARCAGLKARGLKGALLLALGVASAAVLLAAVV